MSTTLFDAGLKVILFLGTIFFFVFAYVCYMWMNRKPFKWRDLLGALTISLLYVFKIILLSVFLLGVVHLILTQFFD